MGKPKRMSREGHKNALHQCLRTGAGLCCSGSVDVYSPETCVTKPQLHPRKGEKSIHGYIDRYITYLYPRTVMRDRQQPNTTSSDRNIVFNA